ncbi:MAG: glutamate racemase [Bacteroidota bacterium]
MDNRPIGLLDSGLGGLSVWRELIKQMPNESTLYIADQINCPYGPRPEAEIRELTGKMIRHLEESDCKMIVIACNTATAASIRWAREYFTVPFVGIEPAIKPAVSQTRSGVVGILATEGTFVGRHFQDAVEKYAGESKLIMRVGEGLVELVESGKLSGPEVKELLNTYLEPMLRADADQIVLGCTHYPFLQTEMEEIVGDRATIIDPSPAVVRHIYRRLSKMDALAPSDQFASHQFFTSGQPESMDPMLDYLGRQERAAHWEPRDFY